MARSDQQFPLRLPPELREMLENAAKESGRSKNAEAVYRLEQSFANEQQIKGSNKFGDPEFRRRLLLTFEKTAMLLEAIENGDAKITVDPSKPENTPSEDPNMPKTEDKGSW